MYFTEIKGKINNISVVIRKVNNSYDRNTSSLSSDSVNSNLLLKVKFIGK